MFSFQSWVFLFVFTLLIPSAAMCSAECTPGTRDGSALGKWKISPKDSSLKISIELDVTKNNSFISGRMLVHQEGVKEIIPVQICEGDCCNEFHEERATLNFWNDKSNKLAKMPGRITLTGKVDWKTGTLSGTLFNHNYEKILDITGIKQSD